MSNEDVEHCPACKSGVLKALYQLNVEAKKHAESAEDAYNTGWKEQARIHSQKKKALYSLKRSILGDFVDNGCVDEVRLHDINGREYYCVYVDGFSFHTPTTEWKNPSFDVVSEETLESFNATADERSDYMSERKALQRLSEQFESPNYHLETPFTHGDYSSTFVGWEYLPGAVEEGDKVPEQHLHERNVDDFGLEIGDDFETSEGRCEITDRYYAYLPPLRDRSPVLQKPVYDVILDGEEKETVRQRRIVDDWWMLAESIADPLPGVDGELGDPEYTRGHIESLTSESVDFEIGDVIEIEPNIETESPIYCRITEVHVSYNILLGQYEAVGPTDEAPMGVAIHELADDVVAVHDSPPVQSS